MTIGMTDDYSTAEIEVLPAVKPTAPEALGALAAHAEAMTNAKKLGDALADTELVPKTYRGKPGNAAAAILYGAELGLNPIQSLQNIFVVHGTPAIYARTMVALVMRHGYVIETDSSTDDSVTVTGTAPDGRTQSSTWDIERATRAGYVPTRLDSGEWKKNGNGNLEGNMKYITDPQAMLYAKAAAEVCRRLAPDVLLGIPQLHEELEPEDRQPIRVRADRADRGIKGLRAAVAAKAVEQTEPESAAPEPDVAPTEPTPEAPEVHMITSAQSKKLYALLRANNLEDKDAALAWISAALGQTIASTKDLTKAQAITVIDKLDQPTEEQPTTTEGNE
ncbi:hypothetical protein P5V90_14810 [Mycobacteroides abscessus subsp. abscessus]|uniref:hypothetical protein n=1 Tax=Mycobacteroides abscessus TaxID=36809 RepID=UPI00266C2C7C|nr:hypothetical protein [Mycobacteroides abscessus]MDO3168237.1 hypothetical protein [Mycobacteroides abscessus subsp. abscessus]